eukprot:TRINITY_DN6355_c0_g1_i1.p1 TRINITY_DN6355_c0_g1~~TRINITY_DN6355_c0_g1_i1.p1  ORF type:complete len:423 (+),score=134.35 TRINITY_DN6355_c0_g1_i1:69-1337(+)
MRFPAEFEEHESIWLSWPKGKGNVMEGTVEGYDIVAVYDTIVFELLPFVSVTIAVDDEYNRSELEERLDQEKNRRNLPSKHSIRVVLLITDSIWMRDFGPIFMVKEDNTLSVLQFGWNSWGYDGHIKEEFDDVQDSNSTVATRAATLISLPLSRATLENQEKLLVSEGGNREYNGNGVLMLVEAVELQRNPHLTRDQIEKGLLDLFKVQKIIWLKEGVVEDRHAFEGMLPGGYLPSFGTGGHIDEFARFTGPNTIVLAEVTEEEARHSPLLALSREKLEENYQILKNSTDVNGKPFEVVRIPSPPLLTIDLKPSDSVYKGLQQLKMKDGTVLDGKSGGKMVLPASYCNFLVTNGLVLFSKYASDNQDENLRKECERADLEARRVMERVFPGRKIVQIDSVAVNCGGGGIHCISQQQPKVSRE